MECFLHRQLHKLTATEGRNGMEKRECHLCKNMRSKGKEREEYNLFRQKVVVFYCTKCYDEITRIFNQFKDKE